MKKKTRTYCFDIDGTLCHLVRKGEDYAKARPIRPMIALVNHLFRLGHTVYLYTGRHTMQAITTRRWLEEHGVEYHHLFLGKPVADVYIDDLAIRCRDVAQVRRELHRAGLGA